MRISLLQDSPGLLAINGFALPAKIAEKRKIIEEIAHNDVKKVSKIYLFFVLHVFSLANSVLEEEHETSPLYLQLFCFALHIL